MERENLPNSGRCRSGGPLNKNQRKQIKSQVFEPCQRILKIMILETDGDTICNWCTRNGSQRLDKRIRRAENQ